MNTSLRHEPPKPNEANKPEGEREQNNFAKPEEQFMVQLENMSQKNEQSRVYTETNYNGSQLSHNINLQTILYPQQNYNRLQAKKTVETLSVIL